MNPNCWIVHAHAIAVPTEESCRLATNDTQQDRETNRERGNIFVYFPPPSGRGRRLQPHHRKNLLVPPATIAMSYSYSLSSRRQVVESTKKILFCNHDQ